MLCRPAAGRGRSLSVDLDVAASLSAAPSPDHPSGVGREPTRSVSANVSPVPLDLQGDGSPAKLTLQELGRLQRGLSRVLPVMLARASVLARADGCVVVDESPRSSACGRCNQPPPPSLYPPSLSCCFPSVAESRYLDPEALDVMCNALASVMRDHEVAPSAGTASAASGSTAETDTDQVMFAPICRSHFKGCVGYSHV